MKKSISCVFVVIIALLYSSVLSMPNIVNSYAQNNTGPQATTTTTTPTQLPTTLTPGVKITTPGSNQQVSVGNNNKTIQLTGTSTDNTTIDCQVSAIANDIKPYQNTTATGPGGESDYSAWTYFLAPPLFNEGSNKVTARISCIDPSIEVGNAAAGPNLVKHSSVFFRVLNATAPVTNGTSINTNASDTTKTSTTTTSTTGTSTRTGAVPYFVFNPSCRVTQTSNDLNCTIKIAGIENIAKIRPFLHADLTASCINPAGNTPPDNIRIIPLIGDSKTISAAVDMNCPPSMTPSFTYKNVKIQVGDVFLSIPGTFSSK
jgi:hypothetical protein